MDYGPIYDESTSTITTTRPPSKLVDKYEMIWWAQLAWTTAFSLMLIIAIGGNTIVIWIVIGEFLCYFVLYLELL